MSRSFENDNTPRRQLGQAAKGVLGKMGLGLAVAAALPGAAAAKQRALFHDTGLAGRIEHQILFGQPVPINPDIAVVPETANGPGVPIIDPVDEKVNGADVYFRLVQEAQGRHAGLGTIRAIRIPNPVSVTSEFWPQLNDPHATPATSVRVQDNTAGKQPAAFVPFTSANGSVQELFIPVGQPGQ